jgi:hypothetical protein
VWCAEDCPTYQDDETAEVAVWILVEVGSDLVDLAGLPQSERRAAWSRSQLFRLLVKADGDPPWEATRP